MKNTLLNENLFSKLYAIIIRTQTYKYDTVLYAFYIQHAHMYFFFFIAIQAQ